MFTFLSLLFKFSVHLTRADPGFFLGGGALVSCSTSTPINHIVFFCRRPVVLENHRSSRGGGGGMCTPCTLPLDPPLISVYSKYYPYPLLPLKSMIVAFLPHPFAYFFIPGYLPRTPDYSNLFRFP